MTTRMSPRPNGISLFQLAAAAICPDGERRWVHAMFAELSAIEGSGGRLAWTVGSASIVLAALRLRALVMLSLRMRVAVIVALAAALASGMLSYADLGAVRIDDDLLAVVSIGATVALVGLAVVAARKIFQRPGLAPGEG